MYRNTYIPENKSPEWATPSLLFKHYDYIFGFTVDVAATKENAKCDRYYTMEDDGLSKDWSGEKVWCNPPYGKQISNWVRKCYESSLNNNTVVVALLPVRTDTKWYHQYIKDKAFVIFEEGRLHFNDAKESAPFPSMTCIWGI